MRGGKQILNPAEHAVFANLRSITRSTTEAVTTGIGFFPKGVFKSTRVYRHAKKEHVLFRADGTLLLNDNSTRSNRFSGLVMSNLPLGIKQALGYPLNYVSENPQPGLYGATPGKNGLPGVITAEVAHYKNKESPYFGSTSYEKEYDKEYFDPQKLLPETDTVVELAMDGGGTYVDLNDPFVQEVMFESLMGEQDKLNRFLINELGVEGGVTPETAAEFMQQVIFDPDSYLIAQAVGNAFLRAGVTIVYPSARLSTIPVAAYVEGSSNLVLPFEQASGLKKTGSRWAYVNGHLKRIKE